jgi:hypothetical protein
MKRHLDRLERQGMLALRIVFAGSIDTTATGDGLGLKESCI